MRYVKKEDVDHLISEILAGRCVAFVGAGFSAAAGLPSWPTLLQRLSERSGVDGGHEGAHLRALLLRGDAHSFDQAAQFLEGRLGRSRFINELHACLGQVHENETIARRLDLLAGIPFRAILTTNFDGLLQGSLPEAASYARVLRGTARSPWSELFSNLGDRQHRRPDPDFVVKLHGDLAVDHADPARKTVVFTRRDYRRRLYEEPGYIEFLHAVMASYTVLYMGFSFTDAYLNELRSETLALTGFARTDKPIAFAIRDGLDELSCEHFRNHEGICLLPYVVQGGSHEGFERILRRLYERTNPLPRLAKLLAGKRILWIDSHHDNNELGVRFFEEAAAQEQRRAAHVEFVTNADQAFAMLDGADAPRYDLIITHWGTDSRPPTAIKLLRGLAGRTWRAPTIVFAGDDDVDRRKRQVLRLGATAYCFEWIALLREVERLFAKASESP